MKNKYTIFKLPLILTILVFAFFTSCNRPSPDQFFQTTILNTNILHEFGSERYTKSLLAETVEFADMPDSKKKGNEAQQVVELKIAYIEQTIKKIEDNEAPDEDGEVIKQKSLELFNYVLPVYKKDYLELAAMCDKKQSENEISEKSDNIIQTYAPTFEEKYVNLIGLGEQYASKHNINASFGN
ncbi:hypothetical protein [Sphingobacterium deserti]|uniref:Lipoprotein n=1 Tax=Sphingobacterium deserti TaxID=1229276 RepID=A0A0B8T6K7_9SPHI|nr:hypothetical protein [Sphingobacterium deserti]KGE12935.1 hypothetical protein DI53_3372 [Sphingobacterium deserti]